MFTSPYHPANSISPDNREEQEFEDFLSELLEFDSDPKVDNIPPLDVSITTVTERFPKDTFYPVINIGLKDQCIHEKRKKGCVKTIRRDITGIFVPPQIKKNERIDLLFYFHGHLNSSTGSEANIHEYFNFTGKEDALNIRQELVNSGRNMILIAPTLGPKSESGVLLKEGWSDYFAAVVRAIEHYGINGKLNLGKIIISGHSGGGKTLLHIAQDNEIDEVWGIDSLYQGGSDWIELAKSRCSSKFNFYYHPTDKDQEPNVTKIRQAKIGDFKHRIHALTRLDLTIIVVEPGGDKKNMKTYPKEIFHHLHLEPNSNPKIKFEPHYKMIRPALRELLSGKKLPEPESIPQHESILDELLHEIGMEYEHSVANTAFRQKLADIALAEYANWGNGSKVETDEDMYNALTSYYADGIRYDCVHKAMTPKVVKSYVDRIQHPPIDPKTKKRKRSPMWSAAFISWVHRKAIGDRAIPFIYSMAHVWYVSCAKLATKRNDPNYPFRVYEFNKVKPEIGDLICNARDKDVTFKNIDSGKGWDLHCDLVVEVPDAASADAYVYTIGGNAENQVGEKKKDTVGKKKIALDANGFIKQRAKNKYIAIVKYIGEE